MAIGPQMIYHPGNCLNKKRPFAKECRLCVRYCPHKAISESHNIKRELCTDCGVCMSVCPSDGFVDSGLEGIRQYLWSAPIAVFHCPLARPVGYELPCLGILDRDAWTVLMILAEEKEIEILTGDCGACDDRDACLCSVNAFKEMSDIWEEVPRVQIRIAPDDGSPLSAAEITRNASARPPAPEREKGLSRFRNLGRRKVKEMLPQVVAEETYRLPLTREWLLAALAERPERKIPYRAIRIGENCTDCQVCARICPQMALSIVQQEGRVRHIYESQYCVQCHRCEQVCGPQTIKLEVIALSHRYLTGKILLRESLPRHCEKCGELIYHLKSPALCMACAQKDPALKGVLY
jgi:Pyruvate/2-oxoacid:ferredoxin oxidoreductase delta subunit